MMGFFRFIFYLKKYPQNYVLILSPWLYKRHHYFRVACVNEDFMVRAVACCLESRFSSSFCQKVLCDGELVCCFSESLGSDLQKQITAEMVISAAEAECQIFKKWGSRCSGLSRVSGCFSCFCDSGLHLKNVFLTSVCPERHHHSAVRNIVKQGLWGGGIVLLEVTGWVSFKVCETLKSKQWIPVGCIQFSSQG